MRRGTNNAPDRLREGAASPDPSSFSNRNSRIRKTLCRESSRELGAAYASFARRGIQPRPSSSHSFPAYPGHCSCPFDVPCTRARRDGSTNSERIACAGEKRRGPELPIGPIPFVRRRVVPLAEAFEFSKTFEHGSHLDAVP